MTLTPFLKRVLLLDAASCLGLGLLLLAAGSALSPLFGLPPAILNGAGLALLPIGLFILAVATRRSVPPAIVLAIVAGNLLWTLESLILIAGTSGITAPGTAFVAAQALAVAALAALEWVGTARARRLAS